MGFGYNKGKHSDDHGSQWTSYSDLFMGLSVVFLLLYVTTSLRSGTTGLQQQIEKERLTMQVQDLQNQLKVYNSLKKESVASAEDEKMYENLLSKLDLLKEEAKTEAEALKQQALENEQKETALNQYQQLVRNMVNANQIAKSRIKKKDEIIVEKNEEISDNKEEITSLNTTVRQKDNIIADNERKISDANQELAQKMKQLKNAYAHQKMSKKAYQAQLAKLQQQNKEEVDALKNENQAVASKLSKASSDLATTKGLLAEREQQARGLVDKLERSKGDYEKKMAQLKGDFEGERAKERAAFESKLAKERLSGEEKAKREARFRADADAKAKALADRMGELQGKMKDTEGALNKALAEVNARKNIASAIKKEFHKAGIKADVDDETGDVMLDFGEHYFETGKADLKPEMIEILQKAFPIYAASILENPNVKVKVKRIEIVGFASPTYKGKFVDPNTLNPQDRKAVDYNLDLSYNRARSIFTQLFDTKKMSFPHQKELLPLVNVTGRSFLADSKTLRNIANNGKGGQFCDKYDCKKAQRVIIKFGFDN